MYAHMGIKVEEWEDGQVNIGIAVCPTKPTAIIAPIAATEHQRNDMLMSHSTGNFVVIPESAFIIRTPEHYQSQGGISVAYARHLSRPSNFVIMLNPQDQGYQNRVEKQKTLSHTHNNNNNSIAVKENMESSEGNGKEVLDTSSKKSDSIIMVSKNMEEKVENSTDKSSEPSVQKRSTSNSKEQNNLTTPQNPDKVSGESLEAATTEVKATGFPEKEASLNPTKRSGDMKRVSWVEDAENFEDKKGSCKNSKENKKESNSNIARKSNGNSSRNSPTKKQQGFSSEDVRNIASEVYTKGDKRSGDRSRIPLIASSAGDYTTSSCEFYRRQMLRECMYNPSTLADNWYGYTSLQKYAGQKVVKKIAAEQKRLEEDISNRRKTEIWILGNETDDDFVLSPCTAPLRKRTTRLKPMQIVQ